MKDLANDPLPPAQAEFIAELERQHWEVDTDPKLPSHFQGFSGRYS